jgi:hypothetical protein
VPFEILRRLWCPAFRQVSGGRNHDDLHWITNPHPNHVSRDALACTYPCIVALRDNVGEGVVHRYVQFEAGGGTVSRSVPAGLARRSFRESSAASYSSSTGRRRAKSRSPAAVAATERVVRSTSRTPRLSSRPRINSLTRDGESPSCFAARVKLFCSKTATNALVSLKPGAPIAPLSLFANPEKTIRIIRSYRPTAPRSMFDRSGAPSPGRSRRPQASSGETEQRSTSRAPTSGTWRTARSSSSTAMSVPASCSNKSAYRPTLHPQS